MFKYSLKDLDGNKKAGKVLDEDIENPWGDKIASRGRKGLAGLHDDHPALVDEETGEEIEPALTKNYTVEKEDITAELEAQKWDKMRAERNAKLTACDWTQMPDAPLTDLQKEEWATYRQALRDLPANTDYPQTPVWPAKPE